MRYTSRLIIFVAILNLVVLVVGLFNLKSSYGRFEQSALTATQNLSQSLIEDLGSKIDATDQVLLTLSDEFTHPSASGQFDRRIYEELIQRQLSRHPSLVAIRMVNAQGEFVAGFAGEKPPPGVDIRDRPYFIAHRDQPESGLVISEPLRGRINGDWGLALSRRLLHPDGSFAGVVAANMGLGQLQSSYSNLDLGAKGVVTLRDEKLRLVLRVTQVNSVAVAGPGQISSALQEALKRNPSIGSYFTGSTSLDHIDRAQSYRKHAQYPFYVSVGLARDEFLQPWYVQVNFALAVFVAFALTSGIGCWLLIAAWQRNEDVQQESLEHYRALVKTQKLLNQTERIGKVGGWEYDAMTARIVWTEEVYRIYEVASDYDPSNVEQAVSFYSDEAQARLSEAFKRAVEQAEPYDFEVPFVSAMGTRKWVKTTGQAEIVDGKVGRVFGEIVDITERKLAEIEREQYVKFFKNSTDLMGIADPNGAFKRINPAFMEMLGYSETEILAKPFIEFIHPDDQKPTMDEMARQLQRGNSLNFENRYVCKDGSIRWLLWRATVNPEEGLTYTSARDITERKRLEAELLEMATTDFLTGLFSRRHFMTRMEEELARIKRRETQSAAVLMLDLDHFKLVNDRFGHSVGDQALKHFAALMSEQLRKIDSGGRVGGEEFAILMTDADADAARGFAERLRMKVAETPLMLGGQLVPVTVSIGIGVMTAADDNADVSLTRSDEALYRAKALGRNRVE